MKEIILESKLTVNEVSDFSRVLKEALLSAQMEYSIDPHALEEIDSAALQLLLSFKKEIEKNNMTLTYKEEGLNIIKEFAKKIGLDINELMQE